MIGSVDVWKMEKLGSFHKPKTEYEGQNYSFYSDGNGTVYLHSGWTSADSSYGSLMRAGSSAHIYIIPLEILSDLLGKLASQPNMIDHIDKEKIEKAIKKQLPCEQNAELLIIERRKQP